MLGKIIISIIFVPINAIILWAASSLGGDRESYKKALLATSLIFVISLLRFISFQGFYGSMVSNFLSWGFGTAILTFFILWWLYKYDFWSLILMWGIWAALQFPFNILQDKILTLPWDMMMQAF
ncbi:MAG: hypothetical protein PF570_04030 [Candidatus Cloacimonetes bacterium]|jgi:hypothetical protein|nr:hypothetical protein [Candidatus Cloacimonadota bacterium]